MTLLVLFVDVPVAFWFVTIPRDTFLLALWLLHRC